MDHHPKRNSSKTNAASNSHSSSSGNNQSSQPLGREDAAPLALLQQQMSAVIQQQALAAAMQAQAPNFQSNPAAAWWYLEYLSRIQAAQMHLPVMGGSGGTAPGATNASSASSLDQSTSVNSSSTSSKQKITSTSASASSNIGTGGISSSSGKSKGQGRLANASLANHQQMPSGNESLINSCHVNSSVSISSTSSSRGRPKRSGDPMTQQLKPKRGRANNSSSSHHSTSSISSTPPVVPDVQLIKLPSSNAATPPSLSSSILTNSQVRGPAITCTPAAPSTETKEQPVNLMGRRKGSKNHPLSTSSIIPTTSSENLKTTTSVLSLNSTTVSNKASCQTKVPLPPAPKPSCSFISSRSEMMTEDPFTHIKGGSTSSGLSLLKRANNGRDSNSPWSSSSTEPDTAHQNTPGVRYVHPILPKPPLGLFNPGSSSISSLGSNALGASGSVKIKKTVASLLGKNSPSVPIVTKEPTSQHHRPWLTGMTPATPKNPALYNEPALINIPNVAKKSNEGNSNDLNLPLIQGWTRSTYISKYGTGGIHGEVYYTPPGSKFKLKTMSEVKKHLNKGLTLKNFSFSSKILVGDFYLPSTGGTEEIKLSAAKLTEWLNREDSGSNPGANFFNGGLEFPSPAKGRSPFPNEPLPKMERVKIDKETKAEKKEKERKKQHYMWIRNMENVRRARRRAKIVAERKAKRFAKYDDAEERERQERREDEARNGLDELNLEAQEFDLKSLEYLRIKGMNLSPKAWANLLQIFEFLHTFGETLGFDMESLPSVSNLQKAFLHVDENEEELLSVLSHLLVCAVEDPGLNSPNKHLTAFGQTLKQADLTFGSLSEVLRLYLCGISESEPEAAKYSEWLKEAPFPAQSPTRKSTIVAFICDVLLQNKAVLKHLDSSADAAHSLKKERQQNDMKLRRLRMLCARQSVIDPVTMEFSKNENSMDRTFSSPEKSCSKDKGASKEKQEDKTIPESSEETRKDSVEAEPDETKVENGLQEVQEPPSDQSNETKDASNPSSQSSPDENSKSLDAQDSLKSVDMEQCMIESSSSPVKSKKDGRKEKDIDESSQPTPTKQTSVDDKKKDEESDSSESDASEVKLSLSEMRTQITKLEGENKKLREGIAMNLRGIRSASLGQDRYRRRYWRLPNAGGVFVEGGETTEFSELCDLVKQAFLENKVAESDCKKENNEEDEEEAKVSEEIKDEEESIETVKVKEEDSSEVELNCCKDENSEPNNNLNESNAAESVEEEKKVAEVAESSDVQPNESQTEAKEEKESVKNEKSSSSKENNTSNTPTLFEVAPPCIKIFSFAPRLPCTGALLKEQSDETKVTKNDDEKMIDHIAPELWNGWWIIKTQDNLRALVEKLHPNGQRERYLRAQLNDIENIVEAEELDDEDIPANVQSPENGWDPELNYKVHLQLLETLETLEERVASASLQVKGWALPSRLLNNSVYGTATPGMGFSESEIISVVKHRLLDLERAIERRYLKPPLGKTANEINLSSIVGEETAQLISGSGASSSSSAGIGSSSSSNLSNSGSTSSRTANNPINYNENAIANNNLLSITQHENRIKNEQAANKKQEISSSRALNQWREGIEKTTCPGVLSMALYTLDSSIAWEKSVMKASCQLCKGGDNEDKLLLCDACDRGYHTYCFKPPLEQIPEGDWFCWECINKATGQRGCIVCGKGQLPGKKLLTCDKCVKAFHMDCLQPPMQKAPRGRWLCADHRANAPKSVTKGRSKGFVNASNASNTPVESKKPESANVSSGETSSTTSCKGNYTTKKHKMEVAWCERVLDLVEAHEDAWPFLHPVNTKQFPTYKKIIKSPMDLSTLRSKLSSYKNCKENFLEDVQLIFDNCEKFNEDDSPVGKAGHSLRNFFVATISSEQV